jgi:lipopolysaccharide/colanic/teichoic acid biosynthesis glycosyltransferase
MVIGMCETNVAVGTSGALVVEQLNGAGLNLKRQRGSACVTAREEPSGFGHLEEPADRRRSVRERILSSERLKRGVDALGSVALLAGLVPVLAVCAAAVQLESPGPILFRQKRIGKDGTAFSMLKFRTMYVDADQRSHQTYGTQFVLGEVAANGKDGAAVFKLVDDPRVTRGGRWMRRLSLDELPQLINVLRGEMSLVGPRPPLPYEVEHYAPRALGRLGAQPGITGLWQVSGRSRTTFEEMVELDLEYIARRSVFLDLQILARTISVVLWPDGH